MKELNKDIFVPVKSLEDYNYVYDTIAKGEGGYSREETQKIMEQVEGKYWAVMYKGDRMGIVFYLKDKGGKYYFEGVSDKSQLTGVRFAIKVGKQFMDYMFGMTDDITTFVWEKDKGIQLLCRRLGFQKFSLVNNMITYKKEKQPCQ